MTDYLIKMHPRFLQAQSERREGGITYQQAFDVWTLFHTEMKAVQTVSRKLSIPEAVVMDCLDGKIWPAVRRYWYDNAVVVP